MIVQVAVSGPFLFALDYRFDALLQFPVVGGRVSVPFRNKTVIGVVMAILTDSVDCDLSKIKPILEVLDTEPLLSDALLTLLKWASHYYHEPIGEVLQAALPKRLRAGEAAEVSGTPAWQLSALGLALTLADLPKNAKHQHALLACFNTAQSQGQTVLSASALSASLDHWRASVKKFVEAGWLTLTQGHCLADGVWGQRPAHCLNPEQQAAVDAVSQRTTLFGAYLLQGVTGSGKTEVYLGMIEQVLAKGQQALVLVPEIGLTPQMVARFEAYLQAPVATLHSGLNDSERHCAWHLVRTGQVKVLLGTRSAVFAPFKHLGICIIDEEHDLSYKQQEGFRYSARDLLVRRAFQEAIPVVLGSATPSLESLHNVAQGRYRHLTLKIRAGNAKMPSIKLLDIRGEKIQEGVSTPLKIAMQQHLTQGGQVLLFLNRRGFAPVLMCHDCGWQASCPSCDANMTLHQTAHTTQGGYLQCHHCGEQQALPPECPSCLSTEFVKVGQGTERLEETIQAWFSDKSVLRIDRDTTRLKGKMAELTGIAERGEADILIGTQMLAKGHHFPNVTLVGLLDIDQGLFSVDYRALERTAQLILQVAGRAGRAKKAGEVLIQTHHPEHPLLITLIKEGYEAFAQKALLERQDAQLPPFKHQILVRAEANLAQDAMAFLQSLKAGLEQVHARSRPEQAHDLQIWGPVSAPMQRRQGRYRFQLLLQSSKRAYLHSVLGELEPYIYKSPLARKVRWSLDVDPQEMV
ncbi:primosomal protein N' [Thiomicrorhabdus aquaedulcis]|uniref:primosomal protein N' n=1 Tax=Thiomicrorhabdus aquaedulcis TaxID=2211106 RepID=UPI000FD88695|nr:primosomal protein N' [Thiomicrorhabdus aquaedulcis]